MDFHSGYLMESQKGYRWGLHSVCPRWGFQKDFLMATLMATRMGYRWVMPTENHWDCRLDSHSVCLRLETPTENH